MFCYKCGKQMVDSALFCPNCGTMVKEDKGAQLAAVADRLKNGDSTAFNDLYAQTQKYVRYVVRQSGLSEHDADDVVQEIYVTIYQKIGDLSDTKAVWGWIKMIAHHAAIDFIRKNSKELLVSEEDDEYVFDNVEETDTLALPEDAMDNKETQRLLGNMLDELPAMQKLAMIDFYFNEKKIKDIAVEQDLSEGTVKSYLAKGRKAMEAKLLAYQKKTGVVLRAMPLAPVMLLVVRQSIQNTLSVAMPSALSAATGAAATGAAKAAAGTAAKAAAGTTAKAAATGTAKTTTAKAAAGTTAKTATAKAAAGTAAKVTAVKAVAGVAAVAVVGTGVAYEIHNRDVPVNEQAVVNTLDEFTDACRNLDNDGILDCLSDESKEIMEAYDITREYARTEEAGTTIEDQRYFRLEYGPIEGNRHGDEASVYCEYVQYVITDGQKTGEKTVASGYLGMIKEHGDWKIRLCRQNETIFTKGSKTSNMRFPELIKNELIYNDEIE